MKTCFFTALRAFAMIATTLAKAVTGPRVAMVLASAALLGAPGSVAQADSSTDYVGPCTGETSAMAPIFLSANSSAQWDITTITMTQTGRFRMGVDGPLAYYDIYLVGPSSYVCNGYAFPNGCSGPPSGSPLGLCTVQQGENASITDITYMSIYGTSQSVCYPGYIPHELPFRYTDLNNGQPFTWYESPSVPPGTYAVRVNAGGGGSNGHGTLDFYAFYGNGGAHEAVNCPKPVPAVTSVYGFDGSSWDYAQSWSDNYISIYGSGFESCAQGYDCGNVVALHGYNTATGQSQYTYFQNNTGTYGAITYESAGQINMLLPSYIQGSVDVAVYNSATSTWSSLPGWSMTIN